MQYMNATKAAPMSARPLQMITGYLSPNIKIIPIERSARVTLAPSRSRILLVTFAPEPFTEPAFTLTACACMPPSRRGRVRAGKNLREKRASREASGQES